MATISTHVLDTALGVPATGMTITLEWVDGSHGERAEGTPIGGGTTDGDGRVRALLAQGETLGPGVYRLRFDTAAYFSASGREAFYPEVAVIFQVHDEAQHYHVPLLLSPFGYSTYRGS